MKQYQLYIILFCIIFLASCKKYIEDTPANAVRTLTTTDDYRLLTNNTNNVEVSLYTFPVLSGVDIYFSDTTYQNNFGTYYTPIYTWAAKYYDAGSSDLNWEGPYGKIYTFNTVINGVMNSTGGTDSVKREIMAEAMLHRSFSYWALVNCYGKQFDSSTAATDLGVPVLLTPDLTANLTRASIKTVYDQIINDTKTAIRYLPALNSYNPYPSKLAGYALLSRIYLFTRNFTAASAYADSALLLKNNIADYNGYISGTTLSYPARINDPEIILSKQQTGSFSPLQINPDLVALLGTTDLRYQLFTRSGTNYSSTWKPDTRIYWRTQYTYEANNIGLTTPELYLIKAECLARSGDLSNALSYLNTLRRNRYAPANYAAVTASSVNDALTLIVNERKKEFFGRGFVWFDQKRLNKDAAFAQTVSRVFQNTTYTLAPNGNLYVYPIGDKYIAFNPEIVQNPR
ncbi:RagB/SusD family nutrient uptake outer membrane protein [Chitinophagaceae bacterium LWZ2-11]